MPTVLIAEDDNLIADNLKKALSRKGVDVSIADNGIEALKLAKETNPQALLLDINLPGMSGIKVLEELNKQPHSTKVIVITGTFDSDTETTVKNMGVYAFLKKPFMIEVLFKLLADLKIINER
ncbi:MAG: response regulator [Candidatus Omnitrophica bacterium]|nr:response regulator [Candidatus Omnitrophota bacterium]MDD5610072.1 response regulator [Candidatus Omnitrophota bacterium]